jgi:hypothetical protein
VIESELKLRDAPPGTAPRDQHRETIPRVSGMSGRLIYRLDEDGGAALAFEGSPTICQLGVRR